MTPTAAPEKADPKKVAAFLAPQLHIRKVELMQTLIARNQSKVRDLIREEKTKSDPNLRKTEAWRAEIRRLGRLNEEFEEDQIDQVLAELTAYDPK